MAVLLLWCRDHSLNLNINKCKPICLGTLRILNVFGFDNIEPVTTKGNMLSYDNSLKNLGSRFTVQVVNH